LGPVHRARIAQAAAASVEHNPALVPVPVPVPVMTDLACRKQIHWL